MKNYTNVKGGMTHWDHYVDNENFNGFIFFLNKYSSKTLKFLNIF